MAVHWRCLNEEGQELESSRTTDDPATFQVGAGDIVGNKLFEVRGCACLETGRPVRLRVGTGAGTEPCGLVGVCGCYCQSSPPVLQSRAHPPLSAHPPARPQAFDAAVRGLAVGESATITVRRATAHTA